MGKDRYLVAHTSDTLLLGDLHSNKLSEVCIYVNCMAKIYCHINLCNESVQYFAILHAEDYCTL